MVAYIATVAELVDDVREPNWHISDGVVVLRRPNSSDLDAHLSGIDDEQIRWLWLPGHRTSWQAMTPEAKRSHTEAVLAGWHAAFGNGTTWTFIVDAANQRYVAMVEANLAAPDVPAGEANISYCAHPRHRGNGYVSRAVRLVLEFLATQTTIERAHLIIDPANAASMRVAESVGAERIESFRNVHDQLMTRNVISLGDVPSRPK